MNFNAFCYIHARYKMDSKRNADTREIQAKKSKFKVKDGPLLGYKLSDEGSKYF